LFRKLCLIDDTFVSRHIVEDKLAKLGYRLRPRTIESRERPGAISFDDRGNAVYQWKGRHLTADSEEAEALRAKALSYEGLAIVDDDPPAEGMIRTNSKGLRMGYNPYESGMLQKKPQPTRKRDLRALSKWIEMKRKLEKQK
jgi:hypothetical protein